MFNRTNETLQRHEELTRVVNVLREARRSSHESLLVNAEHELRSPTDSNFEDDVRQSQSHVLTQTNLSEDENYSNFLDASCG